MIDYSSFIIPQGHSGIIKFRSQARGVRVQKNKSAKPCANNVRARARKSRRRTAAAWQNIFAPRENTRRPCPPFYNAFYPPLSARAPCVLCTRARAHPLGIMKSGIAQCASQCCHHVHAYTRLAPPSGFFSPSAALVARVARERASEKMRDIVKEARGVACLPTSSYDG